MWGLGAHARPRPPEGTRRGYAIGRWCSRVSGLAEINGELPVAVLAEEIETEGTGQIRAMITIAGNPVLTTPHSGRLDAALASLELMVSVDIYLNETTRHADVILPVPSALEKSHYDAAFYGQSLRRIANWSPAVFTSDQPSDTAVLGRLALVLRGEGPNGDTDKLDEELLMGILDKAVANRRANVYGPRRDGASTDGRWRVSARPHCRRLGQDRSVRRWLRTWQRRLVAGRAAGEPARNRPRPARAAPPERPQHAVGQGRARPATVIDAARRLLDEPLRRDGLTLISRRDLRSGNSWLHNVNVLMKGKERCTLLIHPRDADERGLVTGDVAEVESARRPDRSTRRGDGRDADRCGVPSVGLGSRCARSAHARRRRPTGRQLEHPHGRCRARSNIGQRSAERIPVTVGRPA